ncbi:DUF4232 domain-containing protein [Amycolatopsis sp. NBC_00355]|uniref:DUF4232 domain-containing protein n=1 Tax=Amycolatopsis sp. NBC_00355 TaxID=2975957 RepID=UPI002E275677
MGNAANARVARVAVLVGAVLVTVTACNGEDTKPANAAPSTNAVVTGVASTATSAPPPTSAPVSKPTVAPGSTTSNPGQLLRCTAGELAVKLGTPAQVEQGQLDVPLVFTNTGTRPCKLYGVPGVDLRGPADPNGPVYSLPRVDDGDKDVTAAPGESANAHLIVLTHTDGSVGSNGSGEWVPTQLVTTPPGQTIPLTLTWPAGVSVLRQDSATHPGSSVHGLTVHA